VATGPGIAPGAGQTAPLTHLPAPAAGLPAPGSPDLRPPVEAPASPVSTPAGVVGFVPALFPAVYGPSVFPATAAGLSSPQAAAIDGSGGAGGGSGAPTPSSGTAGSGGSGVAFSTLFGLLVALASFAVQPLGRRLRLASAPWRPRAFAAVIERPG
jgi:hypothetical protein